MKTLKLLLTVTILLSALLSLAGCGRPQTKKPAEPISLSGVSKQQAMDTAEKVLRKMNFTIAKADTEQGIIKTRPLQGAQFFEFWRSDNVGAFNNAEANMHTIRRTVELNINQQDGRLSINCQAKIQRLNVPELEVTGTAQTFSMFSKSSGSKQVLKFNQKQKDKICWVDLGNDSKLASRILKRIEKRIEKL